MQISLNKEKEIMRKTRAVVSAAMALIVVGFVTATAATVSSPATPKTVETVYPWLSSGPLASAKLATLPVGMVLCSGNIKYTQKQLDADIAKEPKEVRQQLKKNQFFLLESMVSEKLLLSEAKAWAKKTSRPAKEDETERMMAYIDSLTSKIVVEEADIKSFYDSNKDSMKNATYDTAKDQIKDYLVSQKKMEILQNQINTISQRIPIQVNAAWVEKQYVKASDNPISKARKSGKPTLVDFSADWCNPSKMMLPILDSLKQEYNGKLNVIIINTEKEQVLSAIFQIDAIPVQIIFDKDGKVVFKHLGFIEKDKLTTELAKIDVK